jgi:hypothetical protein
MNRKDLLNEKGNNVMTIECHNTECPKHSFHSGGEGPFCYETKCVEPAEQVVKRYNTTDIGNICNLCGVGRTLFNEFFCPSCTSNTEWNDYIS